MDKSVLITLIVVAGVVILGAMILSSFGGVLPQTNTVTGNGQSTISVTPDLVTVYFSVETKGTTSEAASNKNSEIVDELTTSLIREGLERDEIVTSGFSVNPDYNWNGGSRTLNGYVARHSIKVQLPTTQSSKIGSIVDAGVSAGANIDYINFELSPELEKEYKAQALKEASEDARMKAESIAEGLGKRIGSLVSVQDSNFGYNPWRLYDSAGGVASAEMAKQATTDIQPGDQQISASVTAVFRLR
jgi:hypothetical protein